MPKGVFKNPEERAKKISKSHFGIKPSKETRLKQSESRKKFYKNGGKHPKGMLGKKPTLEHRKKISEANKGEKAYNWKGGTSKGYKTGYYSFEYKAWREAVFKRDDYICQNCFGKRGQYITAHHIKSFAYYPKLRFDINNGITLCEDCHKLTDNYKGKAKK